MTARIAMGRKHFNRSNRKFQRDREKFLEEGIMR